jgi:hypothetical protein
MRTQSLWAMFAAVTLAAVVCAQEPGPEPGSVIVRREIRAIPGNTGDVMYGPAGPAALDFIGAEMSFSDKPVKGAPYAAQAVTETTQTLSDGNRITRKSTASVYRDSQGRTRREETMRAIGPWAAGGDPPQTVFISDPVAGVSYHLNPQTHVAHKLPMGKEGFFLSQAGPPGSTSTFFSTHTARQGGTEVTVAGTAVAALAVSGGKIANSDVKTESLGKQTIEGVEVEGTRSTITIPAGAIGNERPIESTSERWYSAQLQTVVMSKRSDPRFGETVYQLTNIQQGAQPQALFEVPSDYTVDEGPQVIRMLKKPEETK